MNKKYFLPKEYQLLEYDEVESTMTTAKNIAAIEEFPVASIGSSPIIFLFFVLGILNKYSTGL